ncbi:MAG: PilZ domain-containing protein [Gammaproteobacteria bacterium]|nr:PilZ domain-containing protein [Gammaproteobacteria bacterium]MCZ6826640.1 PilZ domain-containing protein [Gammaproteobacteria bacterium]MCZ6880628.1 PilZ domain-containing protein [Gammaproteobacteria bacterium]
MAKKSERRINLRHKALTTVYLSVPGTGGRRCIARNVSSRGVFVETDTLDLMRGTQVELIFAVNLGKVTRIHRRPAEIAHISIKGAGLHMTKTGSDSLY